MKNQIETLPVKEAFLSGDECPFCRLERDAEQRTIRYVLGPGASYMEPDVRGATDRLGFCRSHYQKMYDYGNVLGNALMMQTYYAGLLEELDAQADAFTLPAKRPLLGKKPSEGENALLTWLRKRRSTCMICQRLEEHLTRYYDTFFALLKEDDFRSSVESCKGFCLRHFEGLLERAQQELPNGRREWFYDTVLRLMRENLARVKGDVDWFVGMFDYRQAGRDWKNSRDAVARGMQKLQGLYPADPPYKKDP